MTTSDQSQLLATLGGVADAYATVALSNIRREYPNVAILDVSGPGQYREPRERHPAFYGSFDWHSGVEMHWVLVRLLRLVPESVDGAAIRAALGDHLTAENLRAELAFCVEHPGFERPYGWAWLLMLAADLETWDDPDGQRWADAVRPLADLFAERLVAWLPKLTYPVRYGIHLNTAFALGRALPFADHRAASGGTASDLRPAIETAARRLFLDDGGYDASREPSGSDFLSPALIEAELMSRLMAPADFARWLTRFLPDLSDGRPTALFTPVTVSDPADGQGSHLHGLNLSRAWCGRLIAEALPGGDGRIPLLLDAAGRHADAALGEVVGSHYMVEHWLAVYALLYLGDTGGGR